MTDQVNPSFHSINQEVISTSLLRRLHAQQTMH